MRCPARSPVPTVPCTDRGRKACQERLILPERVDAVLFEKATPLQQTHDARGCHFGDALHVVFRRRQPAGPAYYGAVCWALLFPGAGSGVSDQTNAPNVLGTDFRSGRVV